MSRPRLAGRRALSASLAGFCLFSISAIADDQTTRPLAGAGTPLPPQTLGADLVPNTSFDIDVVAKQLNEARINIEPKIGASTYTLSQPAIQDLPNGSSTAIDDAILQMPGVDQDNAANSGLHVRNEHLNVQYRIDGVILPDGVSFFGQDLSTRFVDSMQLITGALPAEYGLRTAGIIDIQSKSGMFQPGGSVTLMGGSHGTANPSLEYGTSVDGYNFYFSGDYLDTNEGVQNVTGKYNPIHDHSEQTHDFAYLEKILDPNNKISFMVGEFNAQFQIPNNPGQPTFPGITAINGTPISAFNSANLNEHQTEGAQFGALSFLHSEGPLDFQVSVISKYSFLDYHPDLLGDLAFNGIGETAERTSWANALQAEGSYRLNEDHTLRVGILISGEHVTSNTNADVLAQTGTDASGNPIFTTTTTNIIDNTQKTSFSYSAYLQDEWRALDTVTVNPGIRYDVVNGYTTGSQFSPRLNTVWKATPSTTVHAGYASYFTPPPQELVATTDLALFANTSAQPAVTQDSPIKNERAQYLDAGVTQEWLPGLKTGVDLYYKYARNLIDEGQFGSPVVLTPFNYHLGINQGVELTANYTAGDFDFYGNLAIAKQKAKGINSAQFNFSPADLVSADSMLVNTDHSQLYTASAGVAYTWWGTRFAADLIAGSGLRSQPANDTQFNGETVPSYEQVNLSITHRFEQAPGGPITLRLSVVNLLDETYLLRSQTGIGVFANQYGPRRSVFASITKEF
ncbi:MAG TPA: TonB-dependent receptor [Stellaceae bacterium]|jgi:outer membrane receptor protein involved in Fe transport|nr:TonB-dependent receptor [Stellaceae bacterium]